MHLIAKPAPHDCLAAIVTHVPIENGFLVDLAVFGRVSTVFVHDVAFEASGVVPGSWHWPERTEGS